MKRLLKKLKILHIDVLVYRMDVVVDYHQPEFKYTIEKHRQRNKWRYYINEGNILIHQSYLYDSIFLLQSIHKKGPVIGDCFTDENYRGQSIYPVVINTIAKEALQNNEREVFMIVNRDNINSIKGIQKAGFVIFASIICKRWLWFYPKRNIKYFK